jgi:hypothetical protein
MNERIFYFFSSSKQFAPDESHMLNFASISIMHKHDAQTGGRVRFMNSINIYEHYISRTDDVKVIGVQCDANTSRKAIC